MRAGSWSGTTGGTMGKGFLIELEDGLFHLDKNRLTQLDDYSQARDCRFLVSAFDKAVTRVMHVESEVKYAEVMAARKLQDEGEFDEPVSVITHWKTRRGKKSTDIFFTALPSRTYYNYLEKVQNHESLLLLVPFFSVLAHIVEIVKNKVPIAVVLRHGRYADLVIGQSNRFFYATRCMAFDTSSAQIESLWETLGREISMASRENSIKVQKMITLNWVDVTEPVPVTVAMGLDPDLAMDMTHFTFDRESVEFKDNFYQISLLGALDAYPWSKAIAQGSGKLVYAADRAASWTMAALALLMIVLAVCGLYFSSRSIEVEKRIQPIESRISKLVSERTQERPELPDYQPVMAFADTLFHNRNMPSLKEIINDLSTGMFAGAKIEELKIGYEGHDVRIRLAGAVTEKFHTAHNVYQGLLKHLEQSGYRIKDHEFETRVESSRFRLDLLWSVK